MKTIIYSFLIMVALICGQCNLIEYGNSIKKDTVTIFQYKKENFTKLAFNGTVTKKVKCDECKLNHYVLMVESDNFKLDSFTLANTFFEPYYCFESYNRLRFSVSSELFNFVVIGDTVQKTMNSLDLLCRTAKFPILSHNEKQWLP